MRSRGCARENHKRRYTDEAVSVSRYDSQGVHNLKSAGKLSPSDREYTTYTEADERVYESSRIVGAFKDEEYNG